MLELDERLAALVGEGDLDLRPRPVLLAARAPCEHEPVRRLVGDHVRPLELLALGRSLVDLAAGAALEDNRRGGAAPPALPARGLGGGPPPPDPAGGRLQR